MSSHVPSQPPCILWRYNPPTPALLFVTMEFLQLVRVFSLLHIVTRARDCLRLFKFDSDARVKTLDTIRKTLSFYVYRDISIAYQDGANEEISSKVDLMKELDVLESNEYDCDYDFHIDLKALFRSLNDAHTAYYTKY
jgi:hypothetical protein